MPFRNPLYLDTDLLANLADYHGVKMPEEMNVTRRTTQGGAKGVGFNKVVTGNLESSRAEELIETYSVSTRPVRLMNDLIDHVTEGSDLIDLEEHPEAPVSNGSTVQITGDLTPSAANEIGSVMVRFLPLLMTGVTSGESEFAPSPAELAQAFINDSGSAHPQLFELSPDTPIEGRRCLVILDPAHLHGGATIEDLEGELSIVAHVDRLVRPGSELTLDKYLFPGLPRTLRRALGKGNERHKLLTGMDKLVGREIKAQDLTIAGPALVLKPLAVF